MAVLVLAEIQHETISSGTLCAIQAAAAFNLPIDVLVIGHQVTDIAAQVAKVEGIRKVLVADNIVYQHYFAENIAPCVTELASPYSHIMAASSTFGKNIMPRVAALMNVMLISDVTKIISDDTFERPIYAGNAIATYQSQDKQKLMTIRPTAFNPAPISGESVAIENLDLTIEASHVRFVNSEIPELERPELTSAKIVVSGGRGLQNKENFQMIERLADKLGAAIGASRAAVDAGFVPNDYQVGQTGKIVAPDLYIAIGISGAIQHLAGIKDAKVIVAINKDADAPIFQVADYGLVADLFQVLPEIEESLK